MSTNTGHGHVRPRPDGVRFRCGGPGLCNECSREAVADLARRQRELDTSVHREHRVPLTLRQVPHEWTLTDVEREQLAEFYAKDARERDVTDAIVRILGAATPRHFAPWALHRGIRLEAPRWGRVCRRWAAKHAGDPISWTADDAREFAAAVDTLDDDDINGIPYGVEVTGGPHYHAIERSTVPAFSPFPPGAAAMEGLHPSLGPLRAPLEAAEAEYELTLTREDPSAPVTVLEERSPRATKPFDGQPT